MTESSGNFRRSDVSAVVCTLNSIASIERCLKSLRAAGVGELIVVDARSTDGTREVATRYADVILEDAGRGLGNARNIGIAETSLPLVINVGSDNVIPAEALETMVRTISEGGLHGVGARTMVEGHDYLSQSMNDWWSARFPPGVVTVIGTPSLYRGDLLRADPFDSSRRFSDDSELCQRWRLKYDARFAISEATVYEVGKNSWTEVIQRCQIYGASDLEVFSNGRAGGWTRARQIQSALHPLRVDLIEPASRLGLPTVLPRLPFLVSFTAMRYASWLRAAAQRR